MAVYFLSFVIPSLINVHTFFITQDSFKILYSHKPMHYNGTEINTNIQYQYLHARDKRMDVTQ